MDNKLDAGELVAGEWIEAAREDLDVAITLAKVPYLVPAAYHCGQAVEKILKTYIIAKENELTRSHDLDLLIKRCEKHSTGFGKFEDACSELTLYSAIRYPPNRKLRKLTEQKIARAISDVKEIFDFTMSELKESGY